MAGPGEEPVEESAPDIVVEPIKCLFEDKDCAHIDGTTPDAKPNRLDCNRCYLTDIRDDARNFYKTALGENRKFQKKSLNLLRKILKELKEPKDK